MAKYVLNVKGVGKCKHSAEDFDASDTVEYRAHPGICSYCKHAGSTGVYTLAFRRGCKGCDTYWWVSTEKHISNLYHYTSCIARTNYYSSKDGAKAWTIWTSDPTKDASATTYVTTNPNAIPNIFDNNKLCKNCKGDGSIKCEKHNLLEAHSYCIHNRVEKHDN